MSQPSRCKKLALLVGSNPLPNYLAAVVLNPEEEIVLVYTPETSRVCERLQNEFKNLFGEQFKLSPIVTNATKVEEIEKVVFHHLDNVDHLHYTGGTKAMAAHVLCALREKGLDKRQFSYLDERNGKLRFDNGIDISLEEHHLGLTLDVILRLHGVKKDQNPINIDGGPTERDAEEIALRVLKDINFLRDLREKIVINKDKCNERQSGKETGLSDFCPSSLGLSLSIPVFFEKDWSREKREGWKAFLQDRWLEWWTACIIKKCLGNQAPHIEVGMRCRWKDTRRKRAVNTEFELDVVFLRGHRLYVISCTTSKDKSKCKSRLFEVAMRSRQMGGDLARSALVCLVDQDDRDDEDHNSKKDNILEQLRSDIDDLWDASNTPKVFGLPHLRQWAGISDEPKFEDLREWLNS